MRNILDYYSIDPTSFRYISHHGILGQKWGVRRYQNPDGSLTAAGKRKLDSNSTKIHTREKKVGNGSVYVEKGRKVETSGPIGGNAQLSRPSRFTSTVSKANQYSGDWKRGESKVSSSTNYKDRKYSKLEDWWGKDERDRLKLAIDFYNNKQNATTQAAYALYTQNYDNKLNKIYDQLQDAIDAYDADASEENKKRYEKLLAKYQNQVKKYEADNMVAAYYNDVINDKDVQSYINKCANDLVNTPSFKVQSKIYAGKKKVEKLLSTINSKTIGKIAISKKR